ncbi:MAG: xanthine dehydrogenase molybdopterin binding subunit [Bacteroidetes bacterium]|nr:xanthine dehydrogenase molybdopterin binding subunit [Bacteroidota bacterium]
MSKSQSQNIAHENAINHVTGNSVFINDILSNTQTLIGRVVYSKYAHAKILSYDISEAKKLKGVSAILTYKDIPGKNNFGPIVHDELCLAEDEVIFIGQAIFLIAAETEEICIEAEKLITIEYEKLDAIVDLETAIKKNNLIAPERKIEVGQAEVTFSKSKNKIEGRLYVGGQEHWYLETQSSLAITGENNEIIVHSSSQNPTETQILVAEVLGIQSKDVVVEVKRMGGAFGGKETQANHVACWSALLANHTKRPVKIHLFRDDDQKITGKRHRFIIDYKASYENNGKIDSVIVELNSDAGSATDLSMSILERSMLHADNSYFVPNMKIIGKAFKTNLPSNTAFRGFGGPQGMAAIETIIDRIARALKKDAAEIRFINYYGINKNNTTPYGQLIEYNQLQKIHEQILIKSEYLKRRKEVDSFNSENEFFKKGLAITPVKFGISFTTAFLNQAGALVHIYKDGSVQVNHGGTEMGQGLHTKIKQIAAAELGINIEKISIASTNTSKVPNTSPTAASSGTDINGMAVKNAMKKLKLRIAEIVLADFNSQNAKVISKIEDIIFENDQILDSKNPERKISFEDAVMKSYFGQVSLSATGFYKTPEIFFDRATGKGKPFHYFAYGMSVSEVIIDILTGYQKIIRTDIIHDAGKSINERIDLGQIEGGFVQGLGWCTTEELKYDKEGNLLNHSPDTYKIPSANDIPEIFNVELLKDAPNPNTIRQSKAIGEPPLMLAFSVWLAIKDAISAVGNHKIEPDFSLPATNEVILLSIENILSDMKK